MLSSHRRQDKSVIRRPLIGSSSAGYRKHRTIISGSSADDRSDSGQNLFELGGSDQMSAVKPVIILPPTCQWRISLFSHGQVSYVSCYLPVIVRHYSDELRWSPDENVLPVSHQCLVTIGLPTGCSDHTPASNVPALYLRDKLKCVRPISDEIGRKWKIYFPTSFRPAAGLCGRGATGNIFCIWNNPKAIYIFASTYVLIILQIQSVLTIILSNLTHLLLYIAWVNAELLDTYYRNLQALFHFVYYISLFFFSAAMASHVTVCMVTTVQSGTTHKKQQQLKQYRRWTPKNPWPPKIHKSQHQPLRHAANSFSVS